MIFEVPCNLSQFMIHKGQGNTKSSGQQFDPKISIVMGSVLPFDPL